MNKLWAKVKFKQERNAEYLIKAFFKNFNPASSISIKGREGKLEIVFENDPPTAIIDAISYCEVFELNYGRKLDECEVNIEKDVDVTLPADTTTLEKEENEASEDSLSESVSETTEETETSSERKDSESETQKEEKSNANSTVNVEATKRKRGRLTKNVKNETDNKKSEPVDVKLDLLDDLAKKSNSFSDFISKISNYLEMDKRTEFFAGLVIAATKVEKITWKNLEESLKESNIFYKPWDKIWVGQQISGKFKAESVTTMPLLNAIKQYENYTFENNADVTVDNISVEETHTEKDEDENSLKPRLKMACMPEIKEFEEVLASVDKTQLVKDRVWYVLSSMGLGNLSKEEQNQIVEIASTAVTKERMEFDIIFVDAKIPMEKSITARMAFSKFLNDFVKKYDDTAKVKLLTFLSELQHIIMFESEIESYSDFMN